MGSETKSNNGEDGRKQGKRYIDFKKQTHEMNKGKELLVNEVIETEKPKNK